MREARYWILLLLPPLMVSVLSAQSMQVQLRGDQIYATAPQIGFLSGKTLEKLRDGTAVPFNFKLLLVPASGGKAIAQVSRNFVLSFDLWEERFSAVQAEPVRLTASHLSASAAESFCLENISIPVSAVEGTRSIILRLEIRVEENQPSESSPGLSLAGLIDVFSRKGKEPPSHWWIVSAPFRLEDLQKHAKGK